MKLGSDLEGDGVETRVIPPQQTLGLDVKAASDLGVRLSL